MFALRNQRVFISYRRSDSEKDAELLYHELTKRYRHVFFDREGILEGDEFRAHIADEIKRCDVFLAVIGRRWVSARNEKGIRLAQPDDVVRFELEQALAREDGDIHLIPVLVDGAAPLDKSRLPNSLERLPDIAAGVVSQAADHSRFADRVLAITLPTLWRRILGIVGSLALALPLLSWVGAHSDLLDAGVIDASFEARAMGIGSWLQSHSAAPNLEVVTIATESGGASAVDPKSRRADYAKLIETLADAGATTVAFDVYLVDSSPHDEALLAAIRAATAKRTVVIFGTVDGRAPPAGFAEAGARFGLICAGSRGTGGVSSVYVGAEKSGLLGLSLLMLHPTAKLDRLDRTTGSLSLSHAHAALPANIPISRVEARHQASDGCPVLSAGEATAELLVEWRLLDAVRGAETPFEEVLDFSSANARRAFAGKSVLVGIQDRDDQPSVFWGHRAEKRYGFELHADAFSTLAAGAAIRPVGSVLHLVIIVAMVIFGALIQHPRWRPARVVRWIYYGAVVIVYVTAAAALYVLAGILVKPSYDLMALLLGAIGARMAVKATTGDLVYVRQLG